MKVGSPAAALLRLVATHSGKQMGPGHSGTYRCSHAQVILETPCRTCSACRPRLIFDQQKRARMNARNALLIGSLALGAVSSARAQCTVTIPASAASITTDSVFSLVAQAVWVCNNAVVDGSSVDPVFFLEPGTSMVFSGLSKNI